MIWKRKRNKPRADATKFTTEYGGKLLRFADITVDMVDLKGGALHDTRM